MREDIEHVYFARIGSIHLALNSQLLTLNYKAASKLRHNSE